MKTIVFVRRDDNHELMANIYKDSSRYTIEDWNDIFVTIGRVVKVIDVDSISIDFWF